MAVTRINNNQISDASAGNVYVGINAASKLQAYSITATKLANNLTSLIFIGLADRPDYPFPIALL